MLNLARFLLLSYAAIAAADRGYCRLGECPWLVTVRRASGGHITSGSILNEYWILTAAQSIIGTDPKNLIVVAGIVHYNGKVDKDFTYLVESFITHEDYGVIVEAKHLKHDDIALIRLIAPIAFNRIIKPIALPVNDVTTYGGQALVIGWKVDKTMGDKATEEIVTLMSPSSCLTEPMHITDHRHICRNKKSPSGTIDVGGPVIEKSVQVGIQSYTRDSYSGSAVYTRVWHYMEWIKNAMTENSTMTPSTSSPTPSPPPSSSQSPTPSPPPSSSQSPTPSPPPSSSPSPTPSPPPSSSLSPSPLPPSSSPSPPLQPSGNLNFKFGFSIFINGTLSLLNKL